MELIIIGPGNGYGPSMRTFSFGSALPESSPRRRLIIEIAAGELIDKIAILTIKLEKINNPGKLSHIQTELEALNAVHHREIEQSREIADLTCQLKEVNERLWEVEDEIRLCEQTKHFGHRFIELARSVYQLNDRRSDIKRRINELVGSRIVEEKSYPGYGNALLQ